MEVLCTLGKLLITWSTWFQSSLDRCCSVYKTAILESLSWVRAILKHLIRLGKASVLLYIRMVDELYFICFAVDIKKGFWVRLENLHCFQNWQIPITKSTVQFFYDLIHISRVEIEIFEPVIAPMSTVSCSLSGRLWLLGCYTNIIFSSMACDLESGWHTKYSMYVLW